MSFSALPTELVRQIIRSTVPATFHSTTYNERQSTLRSLCLVSRLFRQLAQPCLYEIIWTDSPESLDAAFEALAQEQEGFVLQHLLVTSAEDSAYLPHQFDKLVQHCSGIRSLVLEAEAGDTFELLSLQSLPSPLHFLQSFAMIELTIDVEKDLSNLQLSGEGFELPAPFVLDKVHTLTLNVGVLEIVATSLGPNHLPSLRNLALLSVYEHEDALQLQTSHFGDLLTQLTTFYTDWELARAAPELFVNHLDRILFHSFGFDLSNFTSLRLPVQNLRVYELFGADSNDPNHAEIEEFIAWIKLGEGVNLLSLYLDSGLQEASRSLKPEGSGLLRDLQAACRKRSIEIVFEQQRDESHIDPSISDEFCRRQENLRG